MKTDKPVPPTAQPSVHLDKYTFYNTTGKLVSRQGREGTVYLLNVEMLEYPKDEFASKQMYSYSVLYSTCDFTYGRHYHLNR